MNVILSCAGETCVGMCDCRSVRTNMFTQSPAPEQKVNAKRRVAEDSGETRPLFALRKLVGAEPQ